MTRLLLPVGLAFIMFALGLGLRPADFQRVFIHPKAIAAGLMAQLVLLPASAWLIAKAFGLSPIHAAGLMILAACPGGVTAGMVTHLARGDTALSISLTALTSVAAFVTVPLVVGFGFAHFAGDVVSIQLPMGPTVGGLFVVTLMPVLLGLWLGSTGRIGTRGQQRIHRAATWVFLLIVVHTFATHWTQIQTHLPAIGPATLTLNLLTMATGAALGALVRLHPEGRIALAMECGIQNSALGITLALTVLARPELAVPSVTYALLMNVSALAVIGWRRRKVGELAYR